MSSSSPYGPSTRTRTSPPFNSLHGAFALHEKNTGLQDPAAAPMHNPCWVWELCCVEDAPGHETVCPAAIALDDGQQGGGLLPRDGREGVPLQRRQLPGADVHLLQGMRTNFSAGCQ